MHIAVKNRQYLFWVGEREEANPPPGKVYTFGKVSSLEVQKFH